LQEWAMKPFQTMTAFEAQSNLAIQNRGTTIRLLVNAECIQSLARAIEEISYVKHPKWEFQLQMTNPQHYSTFVAKINTF
jgi:hypothetical protein